MTKNNFKINKGFTLVETLVAVTIMMIAIAGPLSISGKSLNAAIDAKNQLIASNLAQEGMEYLQNIKDNDNPSTAENWIMITAAACQSTPYCGVSPIEPGNGGDPYHPHTANINVCTLMNNDCTLRLDTAGNGYNYNGSGSNTIFKRYFKTSNLTSHVPSSSEVTVTVVVSWKTGSVENQVQLQKIMSNVPR